MRPRLLQGMFFGPSLVTLETDRLKVLDVDRSASDRDLKSAYRRLSKKFHPDKNPYTPPTHPFRTAPLLTLSQR